MEESSSMAQGCLQLGSSHSGTSSDGVQILYRRALSSLEENYVKSTEGGSGIIVYGILLQRKRETGEAAACCEVEMRHVVRATEMVMAKHPMLGAEIVSEERKMFVQLVEKNSTRGHGGGMVRSRFRNHIREWVEQKPWPASASTEGGKQHEGLGKEEEDDDDDEGYGYALLCRALVQELNTHFLNGDGVPLPPLPLFKVCFYSASHSTWKALVIRLHNALFDCTSARMVGRELAVATMRAVRELAAPESYGSDSLSESDIPLGSSGGGLPKPIEEVLPKAQNSKSFVKRGLEIVAYLLKAKNWRLLPFNYDMLGNVDTNNTLFSGINGDANNTLFSGINGDDDDNNNDARHFTIHNSSSNIKNNHILSFNFKLPLPSSTLKQLQQPWLSFRSDLVNLSLGIEGTRWLFTACEREQIPWRVAIITSFLKGASIFMNTSKGDKLHEFAFSCVMDCRGNLNHPIDNEELGNYSLSLLMAAKVNDEKTNFWDLAHHVAQSISRDTLKGKHISKMPLLNMLFSEVLKHPSMTPSSSCRTMLFSLLMDKPLNEMWNIEETKCVLGTLGPLTSLHFVGPCFSIAETMINGSELLLTLVYPSPLYSHNQMLQFLTTSIDILRLSTK